MARVRIGILLIVLSWLPIAQVVLYFAHHAGHLTSGSASNKLRLEIWAIQVVIGLIGAWLVGKIAATAAKTDGWKRIPANLWQLFRYGDSGEDSRNSER